MARLPFRTAYLFGSTAPASSVAKFGSLAAGAPVLLNPPADPATIQALSQWKAGWTPPTGGAVSNNQPAIEDVMAKDYVDSYFLNYLQQIGIVEFDGSGNTPYDKYCVVNGALSTSDYQIYMAVADGAQGNALSNRTYWDLLGNRMKGHGIALAWAVFDGRTGALSSSFNVGSVTRVGVGQYLVNFTNALPADGGGNGLYTMVGSAGTPNGGTSIGGDNNVICGGGPLGTLAVKTGSQCQVFCWEPNLGGSGALEDSSQISVEFFGT